MKTNVFIITCLFMVSVAFGQNKDTVSIDDAIHSSLDYLNKHLSPGTKIAILNFTASPSISSYVIEELISALVNDRRLTVVDRKDLRLLQEEMNFQLSGEVSDESAQSIGKKLGAQTIISGSLTPFGSFWRMQIKALKVETAEIQGISTYIIHKDLVLSTLLPKSQKTTGEKIGSGALNILFGLGSYLDRDIAGGLTMTAGYTISVGLFIVEAVALDWNNPAVGVPGTIGFVSAGLTLAYGFIRPFIYNRSQQQTALLDNIKIEIVRSSHNGYNDKAIHLSYVFKF